MNEPQILKENQIFNETQIKNEPQILKEHKISKETQITNKPKILKHCKISTKKTNYEWISNLKTTPNLHLN